MTKQELRQLIRSLKADRPSPQPLPVGRGVDSSVTDNSKSKGNYSPPYREGQGGGSLGSLGSLFANSHFSHARTLLLYSALPDEVPTQALLDELVRQGKTVLLPRVISDTEMELRRYTNYGDLQRGAFGIMEPVGELFTRYADIDVAVIPGMAFDRQGHRLGRGRGYYDRFLLRLPHAYKIGLCHPFQLVDEVPTDDHDIPMDCVIC